MDQFRHGVIVCSCGYRTQRCVCCPKKVIWRANICLTCQTAMMTVNVVPKAIEGLTLEAERLDRLGRYLYPNDPINNRAGVAVSPGMFLETRDKHSILLQTGCDWYFWARYADQARWRELDNWHEWRMVGPSPCYDCKQPINCGWISFPLGVLLCQTCKGALDRSKEALCASSTELDG